MLPPTTVTTFVITVPSPYCDLSLLASNNIPPILPVVAVIEPLITIVLLPGSKWNCEELISIFPFEPLINCDEPWPK